MKHSTVFRGFTLVELVAVIAIIGLLILILLPAVQSVREASRRVSCMNNTRQLAIAAHSFEAAFGHLPSGINARNASGSASSTWLSRLLPYIDQQNVWDRSRQDYYRDPSPFNSHSGMSQLIPAFACPSDPESGKTHWTHQNRIVASTNYLGVNGTNFRREDGIFYLQSKTKWSEVQDGQSNTLMIGERPPSADYFYGWWYAGYGRKGSGSPDSLLGVAELNDLVEPGVTTFLEGCPPGPYRFQKGKYGQQCDTLHYWSYHPGGAVFANADASTHLLAYDIDIAVMNSIATRNGGEVFDPPWN